MLKFLKKKDDENTPPDVGKEGDEEYKEDAATPDIPDDNAPEEISEKPARRGRPGRNMQPVSQPTFQVQAQPSFSDERSSLELEKINARLEVINSMVKSFNERFSLVNQQIGEIRTMAVANEKSQSVSNLDAKKVIELVKEVTPEKLRLDYRRADLRLNTLSEKLESNKQFMDSIMEELKDLKRRANLFEGTDALLKLSEDVKKDLIEIQKTNSRVKMNADKSEQIFIELNKGFQENEKISQMVMNLDASYSGLRKEIEKINLDYQQILNVNDFNNFKKIIEGKFAVLENALSDIENIKTEVEKSSKITERILFMEKRNEEDIANLGLATGNGDVKKMGDYEKELFSFLELMDKMAFEINRIKERVGLKPRTMTAMPVQRNARAGMQYANPANAAAFRQAPANNPPANMQINNNNNNNNPSNEVPVQEENPFNENWEEKTVPVSPEMNPPEENSPVPIARNENQINELLVNGENCIANHDLADAVTIYEEISDLYNPAEDEDNLTYPKIMQFYDDLSDAVNASAPVPSNPETENPSNKEPANNPEAGPIQMEKLPYKKLKDY
jgi:hypothetical protein